MNLVEPLTINFMEDLEVKKVYHTPITIRTVCTNGSERYGANAICEYWMVEFDSVRIEISQHGKTKKEALSKLLSFLDGNGKYERIEVTN